MKHNYNKPCSTPICFAVGEDIMLAQSQTKMNGNKALSNEKEYWNNDIWAGMDENEE